MNWIYAKRKEREKAYTYGRTLVTPDRWEYFKCLALGEKWCTAAAEYACRRNPKILARLEKTAFGICYPMAAKKIITQMARQSEKPKS